VFAGLLIRVVRSFSTYLPNYNALEDNYYLKYDEMCRKIAELTIHHSPLTIAKVRTFWNYTSTILCDFLGNLYHRRFIFRVPSVYK
jgi:hypothetical protein